MRALLISLVLAALVSCGGAGPAQSPQVHHAHHVVVVESVPLETTLGEPDVPRASDVWLDMIKNARTTIDLGEFYISDAPGSHLHAVLVEIERAAARGVHVRLLVDETFYAKYPETVDAWSHMPNMETRRLNLKPGVLHAKYFIVDAREAYLGSQNFDWRSLDHIFEIGVRFHGPNIVGSLAAIFDADWNVAGGAPFELAKTLIKEQVNGGEIIFAASPQKMVTEEMWELPRLLTWIKETTTTLRVELLTYKTKNRDGSDFLELDDALRAAAKRGVHIEILISSWNAKDPAVIALAAVANIEVRVLTIPAFSGGEIAFARVAHAKYALFDGTRTWIGTSNWEGDYFYHSRNVALFLEHVQTPLPTVFSDAWSSAYAHPI